MTAPEVDVRSVEAISELASVLNRIQVQVLDALAGADREAAAWVRWSLTVEQEAADHVARCGEALLAAQEAHDACLAAGEDGAESYCESEAYAVREAADLLLRARRRSERIGAGAGAIRDAVELFGGHSRHCQRALSDRVDAACLLLRRIEESLRTYLATAVPGAAEVPGSSAAGTSSLPARSRAVTPASLADHGNASDDYSPRAQAERWRELGIIDVPLAAIDWREVDIGPDHFAKVSYATIAAGIARLANEVKPQVDRGEGRDYFRKRDGEAGLDYAHGLESVYDAFYGGDPIRLTKSAGRYSVTNGRHRLLVARKLGLESVPASVVEDVTKAPREKP
jgi:hypothetical protein